MWALESEAEAAGRSMIRQERLPHAAQAPVAWRIGRMDVSRRKHLSTRIGGAGVCLGAGARKRGESVGTAGDAEQAPHPVGSGRDLLG
jgi:hypothetical protein